LCGNIEHPSIRPLVYMRVQLWSKHMGWECGAIGNILGNKLETWWDLYGNTLGTIPTPKKPNQKNWAFLSAH